MFKITSVWQTDIYLLLVAISHEGVTSLCVLDNADMNKHGQWRHDNDSIKRRSSVSKKQILLKNKKKKQKPTAMNQTADKKMNKCPQTNNVKTLSSPTGCAPASPDPTT